MFSSLCTVIADTSQIGRTLRPQRGLMGIPFYSREFSIVLLFGLTELKAQLCWMEDVSPHFTRVPHFSFSDHDTAFEQGEEKRYRTKLLECTVLPMLTCSLIGVKQLLFTTRRMSSND